MAGFARPFVRMRIAARTFPILILKHQFKKFTTDPQVNWRWPLSCKGIGLWNDRRSFARPDYPPKETINFDQPMRQLMRSQPNAHCLYHRPRDPEFPIDRCRLRPASNAARISRSCRRAAAEAASRLPGFTSAGNLARILDAFDGALSGTDGSHRLRTNPRIRPLKGST